MDAKEFLKSIDFSPDREEIEEIEKKTKMIKDSIKEEILKQRTNADVFIGGSLAKGTLVKSDEYDIDVFIRFAEDYEDLSGILERTLRKVCEKNNLVLERLHGSRDYFRIPISKKITFEIIPVLKISSPKKAKNVTDLSYFHVNYVKNKLKNEEIKRQIGIAKRFCKAQGIYGAESYVSGFSGYALECLIINYRTFEKFAKEMIKVKEKLILDPERYFRRKKDIALEINESKIQSPVVLIDPTWKERNVLAGLGLETLKKFQSVVKTFLKNPSEEYFEKRRVDSEKLREKAEKIGAEFLHVIMETNKQEGDIAGTKMKKFSRYIKECLQKYFDIFEEEFVYSLKKRADFYIILKRKKEIIKNGPPLKMIYEAERFKKINKGYFVKRGRLFAKEMINLGVKEFVNSWIDKYDKTIKSMGITYLEIKV